MSIRNEYLMEKFNEYFDVQIQSMLDYVNGTMVSGGITEAESQRLVLINAINNLDAAVNGTSAEDLKASDKPLDNS